MTRPAILIIEDDPDITDVLTGMLTMNGYQVTAITEASDIVQMVSKLKPDLIITDYILQGINGGEYCSAIKRDTQTSHIPVIILSGYGKLLDSLGTYGADKILDKPFDMDELYATVAGLLAVSQNR